MRARYLIPTALILALAHAGIARADYTGQTIDGSLEFSGLTTNFFTLSSLTAPGTFSYSDSSNTDTAVFTGTTLTITDIIAPAANSAGWSMTFTASAKPFTTLSLLSTSFLPKVTTSLTAGTITVSWAGTATSGTYQAVFGLTVPEPATLTLLATGVLGLALARGRRAASRSLVAGG
ncbi:MAG: PEP-CTERM sorting domain-containing protein [Rhodospirillales bacterium]|nr:PEP-CTERM sorting domain-containing protein [Rhodospirillales bacterium]